MVGEEPDANATFAAEGWDSLDILALITEIEYDLNIDFPEEIADQVETLEQLADWIFQNRSPTTDS